MIFSGEVTKRLWRDAAPVILLLSFAVALPVNGVNYNYQIIADRNDVIDGRTVGSINQVAISGNGNIVFASSINAGNGGIFTPTSLIAQTGDTIDGKQIFLRPTLPDINNAGVVVFTARVGSSTFGNEAILTGTRIVADKDSVIDGHNIDTVLAAPVINNRGEIVFLARPDTGGTGVFTETNRLAQSSINGPFQSIFGSDPGLNDDGTAVFEARDTNNVTGVGSSAGGFFAQLGDSFGGRNWNGAGVGGVDPVINNNDLAAWYGFADQRPAIMASDGRLIARATDPAGSDFIRDFNSNLAINNNDQIAYTFRFQGIGGGAVRVDNSFVAQTGDTIMGLDLGTFTGTVDIDDAGRVLFVANTRPTGQLGAFTSTLILATPVPDGNFVAKLTTGSPVTLSQTIDTPTTGPVSLDFDYLFETTTGVLDVFLNGDLLGTLNAPGTLESDFQSASFAIDPSLLNLTGVDLTFEMDGPTGSVVFIDNVELSGSTLINGDFQDASIAPWQFTTTGNGLVQVVPFTGVGVPEPATGLLAAFGCMVVLGRRRRVA